MTTTEEIKDVWFEPRTCTLYTSEPDRRNVYRLRDTKDNRKQLNDLIGTPDLIGWLEAREIEAEHVAREHNGPRKPGWFIRYF